MVFNLFPILLCLWLLLLLSTVRADDTHVTCDDSIAKDANFTWWNNKNGSNPCTSPLVVPIVSQTRLTGQVLQALLRECDADRTPVLHLLVVIPHEYSLDTIHLMPASPLHPPDICLSTAVGQTGGETDFTPCCCNTAAYALRQACWSCQQGSEDPRKPDRRPTFREYLQCPKTVSNPKALYVAAHAFSLSRFLMRARPKVQAGTRAEVGVHCGEFSRSRTRARRD